MATDSARRGHGGAVAEPSPDLVVYVVFNKYNADLEPEPLAEARRRDEVAAIGDGHLRPVPERRRADPGELRPVRQVGQDRGLRLPCENPPPKGRSIRDRVETISAAILTTRRGLVAQGRAGLGLDLVPVLAQHQGEPHIGCCETRPTRVSIKTSVGSILDDSAVVAIVNRDGVHGPVGPRRGRRYLDRADGGRQQEQQHRRQDREPRRRHRRPGRDVLQFEQCDQYSRHEPAAPWRDELERPDGHGQRGDDTGLVVLENAPGPEAPG